MKRRQEWTPDTHPGQTFVLEWDDEDPEAPQTCLEVKGRGATKERAAAAAVHAEALGLNVLKNAEIMPALIAAAPASEKRVRLDEDGNEVEELKSPPRFYVEGGKLKADVAHIKDKAARDAFDAIVKDKAK